MNDQRHPQDAGATARHGLTPEGEAQTAAIARKHGVDQEAVVALLLAMERGGGRQAQFNHPDLGGMGQWSSGGMLMVGDMFNQALKAKVAALCADVAPLTGGDLLATNAATTSARWWPDDLGQPASSGSQNHRRYAVFPDSHRLAIDDCGTVTIYDTADHRITGLGQQQGGGHPLSLNSQHGPVRLDSLTIVDGGAGPDRQAAPPPADAASPSADRVEDEAVGVFTKIERLADLHAKGVLSQAEFETKKAELLARI